MHKLVTIQSDANDCGPAVIYSLVKYYNGYVSMEKIRLDTNLGKEGVTAYDMVMTLRHYGFEAEGLRITIEDLKNISMPIILHCHLTSFDHYVLLLKNKGNIWTIMDPGKGIVKISTSELTSMWTRVAIKAVPISNIIKLDRSTSLFLLIKKLLYQNRKLTIKILVIGLFLNGLNLVLNYYLQFLKYFSRYKEIILLFLFLTIIKILSEYYFANLELQFSKKIDYALIDSYMKHFLRVPLPYLEGATSGRTLKHIEDLQMIKEAILELLIKVFLALFQVIGCLVLLIKLNKYLSMGLGFIIGVYIILKLKEDKKIRSSTSSLIDKVNVYQDNLISSIKNYRTIKDLHKETYYHRQLMKDTIDYLDFQNFYGKVLNKWQFQENLFLEVGMFILMSYGFILNKSNKINLIELFTFIMLTNYLIYILKDLLNILPRYYYLRQSFQRISEFGDIEEEKYKGLDFTNGNIEFKHVSFKYNNGHAVINNLNQIIFKGQKVMLIGKSGTGKSTLCKLLYEYYPLTNGSISINGIDIKDINKSSLRENIGYVSQNAVLFKKTILENIVLDKKVDIDEVNRVLSICNLDNVVKRLSNHLNTNLQESSTNLSGGEVQRIILARALYNIKPIMLLDEALSQVDIETERKIIRNIMNNYKACTLIYVTHKEVEDMFKNKISLF